MTPKEMATDVLIQTLLLAHIDPVEMMDGPHGYDKGLSEAKQRAVRTHVQKIALGMVKTKLRYLERQGYDISGWGIEL